MPQLPPPGPARLVFTDVIPLASGAFGGTTVLIEGGSPGNDSATRAQTDYVPDTGNCSVTTPSSITIPSSLQGGDAHSR